MEQLSTSSETVNPSGILQLKCVARDPDRDRLVFIWSSTGGTLSGEGPAVTWKAPEAPGSYTITAAVKDGKGGEATGQLQVTVLSEQNSPPFIKNMTADPWKVDRGKTSKLSITAVDIDGDEITYTWSANGGTISGEGPVVTWTAPKKDGPYIITAYATDSKGTRSTKKFISVTVFCDCK
jgi:hypothetical protein